MNLRKVQELLDAKVLVGEEFLDRPVKTCCGSDLMSDVLAFTKLNTLLCTGLTNMQVIRTADMTDLCALSTSLPTTAITQKTSFPLW